MSYRIAPANEDDIKRRIVDDKSNFKYPKSFRKKVNVSLVNLDVIKQWISDTINEQLPDDDIVVDYVYELLQLDADSSPDIKAIHLQMNDFLGEDELMKFCDELWKLLLSAQEDKDGIPSQLIEERKKKLEQQEKERQEKRINERSKSEKDNKRPFKDTPDSNRQTSFEPRKRTNYNRQSSKERDRNRENYPRESNYPRDGDLSVSDHSKPNYPKRDYSRDSRGREYSYRNQRDTSYNHRSARDRDPN